jgi:GNAT superfamily N-acetyltransferase
VNKDKARWIQLGPGRMLRQLKVLFASNSYAQTENSNGTTGGIVEPCGIELDTEGSQDALNPIRESLVRFNVSKAGDHCYEPLNLILKDGRDNTAGGLIASTYWSWLHIDLMWVDESIRRKGYGRQLVLTAEKVAYRRGCHHAYLETFSFQNALAFYQSLGYIQFGVIGSYPGVHQKYFLEKSLIGRLL